MSPEQARGSRDEIKHFTDRYSMAVIAYEVLTGKLPIEYDTGDMIAYLRKIVGTPPTPIFKHNANIPEELGNAIMISLNKDPVLRTIPILELGEKMNQYASLLK